MLTFDKGYTYWDQTATGNYIMVSRTAISESLDKIVYGPNTIPAKLTISRISKLFRDLGSSFVRHPFMGVAAIIGTLVLAYVGFRRRRAHRLRLGGSQFRMEETMGSLGSFKDGLLGQQSTGNTKAD
jgi:protein disulfide-isomerase